MDVVATDCEHVDRGRPTGRVVPDPKVSAGHCVVPKLRGLTAKKARRKLTKAGCRAKVRRAASRRVSRGRVIRQSVRSGRRLEAGATATLTISRGRS